MKKLFSILMVAFALTAMVACDKEDNGDGSNGGNNNNQTLILADNTLVYNGVTYHMIPEVLSWGTELTRMWATSTETDDNSEPIIRFDGLHIYPTTWGRTMNLASPVEGDEWILAFMGSVLSCNASFEEGGLGGELDGQNYNNESIFTKGTLLISGNNDGTPITVTLDGTLKNGKTLQMKLVSDNYNMNQPTK